VKKRKLAGFDRYWAALDYWKKHRMQPDQIRAVLTDVAPLARHTIALDAFKEALETGPAYDAMMGMRRGWYRHWKVKTWKRLYELLTDLYPVE
jgi:hypothetical protein